MVAHLNVALELAARGWAVHPLRPNDKVPASPHGCKDATTDHAQIRHWWRASRSANIGLATGPVSGLWVLDIDGEAGARSLSELEAAHGALPATLMVRTARGLHLYWNAPAGLDVRNGAAVRPGIDVRGEGGYVVAPGSIHPSGARYEWVDASTEPTDAPSWLLSLVVRAAPEEGSVQPAAPPPPAAAGGPQLRDPLHRRAFDDAIARMRASYGPNPATRAGGNRNATLNREAHALGAVGVPRHLAESALVAEACAAGLSEAEARATFASGFDDGVRKPRARKAVRPGWIRETRVDGLPERRADDERAPPESQREAVEVPGAHGERDDPPAVVESSPAHSALSSLPSRRKPSPEKWGKLLLRSDEGKIRATGPNAMLIATHDDRLSSVLAYDDHARRCVVIASPPWADDVGAQAYPRALDNHDVSAFRVWLQTEYDVPIGKDDTVGALEHSAYQCRFDPVREYLDGLRWDGQARLDGWLGDALGVTGEMARVFGARWMIAAVARVYSPGCKVDSMLVLEGPQGIGKSTALRILGGDFFSDAFVDLNNKDGDQIIQGVWIQELGELAGMGKAELNRTKGWITRQVDRFRAPYRALPEAYARRAVFAATTNERNYLRDTTGNRRVWPNLCVCKLDATALAAKRDQLWAEAVVRYQRGAKWWLDTPELVRAAEALTSERMEVDPWEDTLSGYLAQREEMTTAEAFVMLDIPRDRRSRADEMRIGNILTRLGFADRRQARRDGHVAWVYFRTVPMEGAA